MSKNMRNHSCCICPIRHFYASDTKIKSCGKWVRVCTYSNNFKITYYLMNGYVQSRPWGDNHCLFAMVMRTSFWIIVMVNICALCSSIWQMIEVAIVWYVVFGLCCSCMLLVFLECTLDCSSLYLRTDIMIWKSRLGIRLILQILHVSLFYLDIVLL